MRTMRELARGEPGRDGRSFQVATRGRDTPHMDADAWQAHGIATRLMKALMKRAAGRGIKRMEGFVMASNAKMLEFTRFLGFEVRSSAKGPQIKIVSRTLDDMATIDSRERA